MIPSSHPGPIRELPRIKGKHLEEQERLECHRDSAKLKLYEAALLISIVIMAEYAMLSQWQAAVIAGMV